MVEKERIGLLLGALELDGGRGYINPSSLARRSFCTPEHGCISKTPACLEHEHVCSKTVTDRFYGAVSVGFWCKSFGCCLGTCWVHSHTNDEHLRTRPTESKATPVL
jgi:hypothetical protein